MKRSFAPLFATNFFGIVNDNFLKTLASFTVIGWIADERLQSVFMGTVAAALVLPYVICSPLADRLTVLLPKVGILRIAKWAELPIVSVAVLGLALESTVLVVAAVLLMGLQSALYSPAKYALVRDVGGAERISTGMGGMEGVSFAAVLAGTIAASFAVDYLPRFAQVACLFGFAVLGLLFSYTIRATEERSRALHAINPIRYFRRAARMAHNYPGLSAVIVTLSVFWWSAAILQMGLLIYGKQVLGLDAMRTGAMLCAAAVGIVLGQVTAGFVDRRRFLLAATPVFGFIAAILLLALFWLPLGPVAFSVLLSLLAFDLGFFKLPFDAEIQKVVKGPRLNTMLAYFNQVSFLFMMFASLCYMAVSALGGPRLFLLLLAIVWLVVPIVFAFHYRSVLCRVGKWIFSRRYDVRVDTMAPLEVKEPILVLPNHPAMVDPMLVGAELWKRPVKPLSDELFLNRGGISARVLKTLGCVKVPDLRKHRSKEGARLARSLQDVVTGALEKGDDVIFYPSGHIWTSPHEEIGTRQLAYTVCRALPPGVRVVAIRTHGLWGSIWSRRGRDSSPAFGWTLMRSVLLWLFVAPFTPRRVVTMHVEDVTERVKAWATLTRLEFNRKLENWYNEGNDEEA